MRRLLLTAIMGLLCYLIHPTNYWEILAVAVVWMIAEKTFVWDAAT